MATRIPLQRALAPAAVVLLLLGSAACSSGIDEPTSSPSVSSSPASISIGTLSVSESGTPDTRYEFTVDSVVPAPPAAVTCALAFDEIVYTAAGTVVDETEQQTDFSLTVASAALDLNASLFENSDIDVVCSVGGASASKSISPKTGADVPDAPIPTLSPAPQEAPAIQINVSDYTLTRRNSIISFVVTVDGGTPGATMDCRITDAQPTVLWNDTVILKESTTDYTLHAYLPATKVSQSGWIIVECSVDGARAIETIGRPAG
ncbi:MAG: hypothetical protein KDC39_03285 [Actinobacteria bacterium]|nr:hypothetical protein [Actinomycetota bacterium]